ncbi:cellulase family glycosylhydrolase [Dactylosporangium sp. NPDC051485]|uniref:cellulase family glycosylhydrolase n=1 Tax=Dactylosporangium sp. NPDC051485 TaxID=3154846 RepID=UPI00344A3B17
MRSVLVLAMLAAAVLLLPEPAPAAPPGPSAAADHAIRVRDGRLVEANGSDLVLRGVNHDFIWYPDKNGSFAAIKAAGANAVRVPLGIGHMFRKTKPEEVSTIVALCRQNRLVCILDAHDTSGWGQDKHATTIADAVRFWIGLKAQLAGQEDHIIINVANEPFGVGADWPWVQQTSDAVRALRAAGFKHTLLVDAPGWGQDEAFLMRDNAPKVEAADPTGNTVFDVHMYGEFNNAAKVNSYLTAFGRNRLPIIIGEFSGQHEWGNPDEDAIMAYAEAHDVGYFGWSWSGNEKEFNYLDLVNDFDPANRTAWGRRLLTGPNGISTDTREATIYRNGTAAAPTAPRGAPARLEVTDVTPHSVRLAWKRGGSGTTYQVVAVNGATETLILTTNRPEVTLTGLHGAKEYTFAVYARGLLGTRSPRSAPVYAVTPPG